MEGMIRILLADDHRMVRQGLRALLEQEEDFEVVGEAADGEGVVELVRRLQPDVALLDLVMPGARGLGTLEKIRRVSPKTEVLILSMLADEFLILEAARLEARGYLLKGGLAEELVEAIRYVHGRRQGKGGGGFYLSREIGEKNAWLRRRLEGERPKPEQGRGGLLSRREREVLELIAQGLTNREIASRLGLSLKTVETHRAKMMEKLGLHRTAELIRYALTRGFKSRLELGLGTEGTKAGAEPKPEPEAGGGSRPPPGSASPPGGLSLLSPR